MSLSLLKRSIGIVEEDLSGNKKKKSKKFLHTNEEANVSSMISEKQKLFGKYRNNRGKEVRYEQLQSSSKVTVEDVKKLNNEKQNKVGENLRKLLRMSSKKLDPKLTGKLLGRAHKGKRLKEIEEQQPKEQESIFTEEDFKAFEKEYMNS